MNGLFPHLAATTAQTQTQKMSPRLQQAVRLLQLSSLEFVQEVHAMLDSNPFLEASDPESPDDGEREPWQADARAERGGLATGDDDTDVMSLIAAETSLAELLLGQLAVLPLRPRELAVATAIVGSLEDDGYLRAPLAEVSGCAALDPPPSHDELLIGLRRVQSLEPSGVAARSLEECLLLQLRDAEPRAHRDLARRIVEHELPALALSHDASALARRLDLPLAAVQRACDHIRRLDPHPGARYAREPVRYITPDVVVRRVRGQWTAVLNPAVVPRVRLNQAYADLFQRHRAGDDGALAGHLRDARWMVRSVKQRYATIVDVAQAILRHQPAFLEYGELGMKPLALRDIADEVGVHESTVSRVTNNKYMATRHGVIEMKRFFSRAMKARSGAEFSGTAVRGLVAEMIDGESPDAPLSDAEIARLLAQQGLSLARRTVTKYRQQLKLEPVERRRRTAA